jgi:hypothetical protein
VVVRDGRLERHPGRERVPDGGREDADARGERLRVPEHDRLGLERVARREQRAAPGGPAARHGLHHRGGVAGVVEVPVRDHQRVHLGRVDLRPGGERPHQRAGAGVHPHGDPAQRPDQPAGVAELGGHREARAGGAEELEGPVRGRGHAAIISAAGWTGTRRARPRPAFRT